MTQRKDSLPALLPALVHLAGGLLLVVLSARGQFRSMVLFPWIFGSLWFLAGTVRLLFVRRRDLASLLFALGSLLALAAPFVQGQVLRAREVGKAAAILSRLEGAPAPPLEHAVARNDSEGRWQNDTLGGEWTVINFWATWCSPCRREMPLLGEFARRHAGAGVRLVGFTRLYGLADDEAARQAEVAEIEEICRDRGIGYPILIERGAATHRSYGVESFPTTVLVDRAGQVVDVDVGLRGTRRILRRVQEILAR